MKGSFRMLITHTNQENNKNMKMHMVFFFTFKDLFTQIYMKKYMIGTISVTAAHMWTGPALIEGWASCP